MTYVEAVIFDCSGTLLDYGSITYRQVIEDVFQQHQLPVTKEQVYRAHTNFKVNSIRTLLEMPHIARILYEQHGNRFSYWHRQQLFLHLQKQWDEKINEESFLDDTVPVLKYLQKEGLKIGVTTEYRRHMMKQIAARLQDEHRILLQSYITDEDTGEIGRPYPLMLYRAMEQLQVYQSSSVVKVGDTIADIQEGRNAGVWTVAVVKGSAQLGLSREEFEALHLIKQQYEIDDTRKIFEQHHAHFVIETIEELPSVIEKIETLLRSGIHPNAVVKQYLS